MFVIAFPQIDPVLIAFGPFAIRWYALAYLAGLIIGWRLAFMIAARQTLWGERTPPSAEAIDDLLLAVALGIVIGGRLGHVLFYEFSYYLENPLQVLAVWHGGMAFHGGLIGAAIAMIFVAHFRHTRILALTDVAAVVAPIGLFFGRLANFINGELWGRPSDVPWAMIFPRADEQPRHPSQLYEAGLEGLAILMILSLVARWGGLKRPGLLSGLFGVCYAIARTVSEFYREPDPQSEALANGWTMGMALSAPLVLVGLWLILTSFKKADAA